eukprot:1139902-Pelagomonas_calceolata.AAC.4
MHANGDERVPSAVLQDGAFYRDGEIRNILLDIPKGEPRSSAMCATCPALSDDVKHNAKRKVKRSAAGIVKEPSTFGNLDNEQGKDYAGQNLRASMFPNLKMNGVPLSLFKLASPENVKI